MTQDRPLIIRVEIEHDRRGRATVERELTRTEADSGDVLGIAEHTASTAARLIGYSLLGDQ